jgi:prefoldin subunit 5
MSAYGLMMDAIHSGTLDEQAKTIEELNKKCDLLYEWIQYLNSQIQELKNERQ